MIRIFLGNVGSGKTACAVREMFKEDHRKTYSNIKTKMEHQIDINPSMIIQKEVVDTKKNKKTGEENPVYQYKLNLDYWKKISKKEKNGINVVLDEAHSIINARRGMSKVNIIMTDWLALLRRILGETEAGIGNLTFITQLPNRIDIIARDMATQVRFHICHYFKKCAKCGVTWQENSEMPEPLTMCSYCRSYNLKKFGHSIEVFHFANMESYILWSKMGMNTFHLRYYVRDIKQYFHLYDTLQWDNLFSDFY